MFFFLLNQVCAPKNPILLSVIGPGMSRSPPKRGRPPRNEKNKTILLRESTFNLWNQKKIDLGFQGNTNSEFAEFLLHSLVQWQFEEESVRMDDGAEGKKNRTAANSKWFVLG